MVTMHTIEIDRIFPYEFSAFIPTHV